MNKFYTIGLDEFKKSFLLYDNYQDQLIIADLDSSIKDRVNAPNPHAAPSRLNQVVLIFALQGEIEMSVDYYPYTISTNDFLLVTPAHLIQATGMSADFRAKVLILDQEFLQQMRPHDLSPSVSNFMEMRKHPLTRFSQEEIAHMMKYISVIKEKIHLHNHLLQPAVIKVSFLSFLLELVNIVFGKYDTLTPVKPSSRREEIMNKFLELLLEHCKEEHEVSYYAERLFITPQYLSLVLKDLTGKTANIMIDQAIIMEAKLLLRSQEYTIQQIADILHFADQSTFGKFFKKNVGVSPLEYKKRLVESYVS